MIDEKKMKEELKDMASKAIDELSPEELENISGGAWTAEKGYYCEYCGASFSGKFAQFMLFSHMYAKHPEAFKNILDKPI